MKNGQNIYELYSVTVVQIDKYCIQQYQKLHKAGYMLERYVSSILLVNMVSHQCDDGLTIGGIVMCNNQFHIQCILLRSQQFRYLTVLRLKVEIF